MTSALKACLRRNPDETGLLKDNMDDGNSKKILSVSQVNPFFNFSVSKKKVVRCQRSLCEIQCIKYNDVVAISASLRYYSMYCLHETLDDNDTCRLRFTSSKSLNCAVVQGFVLNYNFLFVEG